MKATIGLALLLSASFAAPLSGQTLADGDPLRGHMSVVKLERYFYPLSLKAAEDSQTYHVRYRNGLGTVVSYTLQVSPVVGLCRYSMTALDPGPDGYRLGTLPSVDGLVRFFGHSLGAPDRSDSTAISRLQLWQGRKGSVRDLLISSLSRDAGSGLLRVVVQYDNISSCVADSSSADWQSF